MADETITTTGIAAHGAARLPSVEVDSFNVELRDGEKFLGDRASRGRLPANSRQMAEAPPQIW
jgi:hypothetical protein